MLSDLIPVVEEAGALALAHFGRLSPAEIAEKGHLDLVTVADRAVEALISARLGALFPDDGIYGEEGGRAAGTSGRVWVIDPIDGTFNFVRGGIDWGISVGLFEGGRPVLGAVLQPARGRLFAGGPGVGAWLNGRPLAALSPFRAGIASAGLGLGGGQPVADGMRAMAALRRDGRAMVRIGNCCTATMAELATGEIDGYVSCGESSWDVMGMWPVVTALGAVSTLEWADRGLEGRMRFLLGKPGFVAAFDEREIFGTDTI